MVAERIAGLARTSALGAARRKRGANASFGVSGLTRSDFVKDECDRHVSGGSVTRAIG